MGFILELLRDSLDLVVFELVIVDHGLYVVVSRMSKAVGIAALVAKPVGLPCVHAALANRIAVFNKTVAIMTVLAVLLDHLAS